MKKLELLAPAGSLEICKAVIDAGADAVYLGGNMFGARAYAKNFDQEQLFEALDYAHMFDKKIFLTVNTLLKNQELEEYLYDYIAPLYEHGLDAAIVQDFGVLSFLHRQFPKLPLHASTQMSITNAHGAGWMKDQGISRVVTAREVSLEEIRDIYEKTGMEIESFVHGALCYCYSGQCLLSSLLGGRSGNRGRCAQPCRLAYDVVDGRGTVYNRNQQYPLSPKDLCTIEFLPEMAKAGVYSYKIEGRMKQLEYAAGVTSIYRKYMDLYKDDPKNYRVEKKDMELLLNLGNRNGFTKGYYFERNNKNLLSLTTSAHKGGEHKRVSEREQKQIPIYVTARFVTGEPAELTLSDDGFSASVTGETVLEAMKQPLNEEDVKARLSKLGDTVYQAEHIFVELSDNAFLPVKQINELRRSAVEALTQMRLESFYRQSEEQDTKTQSQRLSLKNDGKRPALSVLVRSKAQLSVALETDFVQGIYIDHTISSDAEQLKDIAGLIRVSGKEAGFAMPYVFRKNSVEKMDREQEVYKSAGFDKVFVRTHDGAGYATSAFPDTPVFADHGLYSYSDTAMEGFRKNGIAGFSAPFELNEKELKNRDNHDSEMILYGWIPVMYTAQCIYKNFEECHRQHPAKHVLSLRDRYAKQFPVICDCANCYNVIYNSQPLYLFGQKDKIEKLGFSGYRLEFLLENEKETRQILKEFKEIFIENKKADMTRWENRFTNGHFKRGIE